MSQARRSQAFITEASSLSQALRRHRLRRGLSLKALAKIADVSVGLLSQIERGISSPSLRTLSKVRLALDVSLAELFNPEPEIPEESYIQRFENRRTMNIGPNRLLKEMLSPDPESELQMMILIIPPGGGSGKEPYCYPGEKCGFVLEGVLRLQLGNETSHLRKGDSFQFDAAIPHGFANPSQREVRVVWVIRHQGTAEPV
jgi:transcriptional regulator with XRE-family HTH domain